MKDLDPSIVGMLVILITSIVVIIIFAIVRLAGPRGIPEPDNIPDPPLSPGHGQFLHNHPEMETYLALFLNEPHDHVIVDRKDWELVIKLLNLKKSKS